MNELISVNYDGEQPTVSGRELHDALGIETKYSDWFRSMRDYGYEEAKDFYSTLSKTSDDSIPEIDHALKISMAKELCTIQRTAIGKQFRQFFIKVEENWNSPESVMARASHLANRKLDELKAENKSLFADNATQTEAVEACPYCEGENVFPNWDVEKQGYIAVCQHCGEEIMLCDECQHSEDNQDRFCDWSKCIVNGCWIECKCFRGTTRSRKIRKEKQKMKQEKPSEIEIGLTDGRKFRLEGDSFGTTSVGNEKIW